MPVASCLEHRMFSKKGPHLFWDIWPTFAFFEIFFFYKWATSVWCGLQEGQKYHIFARSGPHPYAIWTARKKEDYESISCSWIGLSSDLINSFINVQIIFLRIWFDLVSTCFSNVTQTRFKKETVCISRCVLEALSAGSVCICTARYQSAAPPPPPRRLFSLRCISVALNTTLKKHDM